VFRFSFTVFHESSNNDCKRVYAHHFAAYASTATGSKLRSCLAMRQAVALLRSDKRRSPGGGGMYFFLFRSLPRSARIAKQAVSHIVAQICKLDGAYRDDGGTD